MWYPMQGVNRETVQLFLALLNDTEVKTEIAKQIRVEMDSERAKYKGTTQSFDSLTKGNVNMQARMAASGYDIYGKTIIGSNSSATNQNVYKKMKNNIKYGKNPTESNRNRGQRTFV